jgi:broad specificity phosphatase PhoE
MQTRIILMRHGLTSANIKNCFAGRTDEPLHPDGILQVKSLVAKIKKEGVTQIISGPAVRTCETAKIIGKALNISSKVEPGLNEIYLPHWDGLTKDEIRNKYGNQYPHWLESPADFEVEGCETLQEVQERAAKALEELFSENRDQTILAVSHLIVVRCLILHYRNMDLADFRTIKVANGDLVYL